MTAAVVTHSAPSRYDHGTMARETERLTPEQRAGLEKRLEAGEWLRPNDVAAVLGLSRSTVQRMMKIGEIGYRVHPPSRYRYANPEHVQKLLRDIRREHFGTEDAGAQT